MPNHLHFEYKLQPFTLSLTKNTYQTLHSQVITTLLRIPPQLTAEFKLHSQSWPNLNQKYTS